MNKDEKKKLLADIHSSILNKYKNANVPMIFQTKDCSEDEWIAKDLSSDKISKIKFIPSDSGTKIIELDNE